MEKTGQISYFSMKYNYYIDQEKLSSALNNYALKQSDLTDINEVLELYNAKKFLDQNEQVFEWSKDKKEEYREKAAGVEEKVREFFSSLTVENVCKSHDQCEVYFWDDFWKLFYQYELYKRIPQDRFEETMIGLRMPPNSMIKNKKFVEYFDAEVSAMFKKPEFGAEFFVEYYFKKKDKTEKYYLPKGVTFEDKKKLISEYIDGTDVSANILDLIVNGQSNNSKEFNADDRLRLKAKKRLEEFWEEKSKGAIKIDSSINISFVPEDVEDYLKFENGNISATYSSTWIKDNQDYPTLLNNFIYLFGYTDLHMRCLLTRTFHESGILEDIFSTNGNGMYKTGQTFNMKNTLANMQMTGYMDVLNRFNLHLEDICKWFFEEYLKEEFGVEGFECNIPKHDASALEKCKLLASALDGVIKQYLLFVQDGEINRELYEMSSSPVSFSNLPSFIAKKYAYTDDSDLRREMRDLYSNQNILSYIEKTKSQYSTLAELLTRENICRADFNSFQLEEINWLLAAGTIDESEGYLKINPARSVILKEFYRQEYICLSYVKNDELKKLIKAGRVKVKSGILYDSEADYIDFLLNKRKFSNGLDLRNKYIHDTGSSDEKKQKNDYATLMEVMIILIIKINEEFCLREIWMKGGTDFYEL